MCVHLSNECLTKKMLNDDNNCSQHHVADQFLVPGTTNPRNCISNTRQITATNWVWGTEREGNDCNGSEFNALAMNSVQRIVRK